MMNNEQEKDLLEGMMVLEIKNQFGVKTSVLYTPYVPKSPNSQMYMEMLISGRPLEFDPYEV